MLLLTALMATVFAPMAKDSCHPHLALSPFGESRVLIDVYIKQILSFTVAHIQFKLIIIFFDH